MLSSLSCLVRRQEELFRIITVDFIVIDQILSIPQILGGEKRMEV
jgi:hypothetical protein